MSVWDWFNDFARNAQANGDSDRMQLVRRYYTAIRLRNTDLDGAIAILAQGRGWAEALDEPWWIAFYDHWIMQFLLTNKQDYKTALDLAVKTSVEVVKPIYAQFPPRICIHEDLIGAYAGIDPNGYADEVGRALDYMELQMTPTLECRFCLQSLRTSFAIACGEWDEATQAGTQFFNSAEESRQAHYQADAMLYLCQFAAREARWQDLAGLAEDGVPLATQSNRPSWVAEFLMWQALALCRLGQPVPASRQYRQALSTLEHADGEPHDRYYDAWCSYLEAIGESEAALKVRNRALTGALASGSPHLECESWLAICQLRARMGILTEDDLAQARQAAQKLRAPAKFLARLDQIRPTTLF